MVLQALKKRESSSDKAYQMLREAADKKETVRTAWIKRRAYIPFLF